MACTNKFKILETCGLQARVKAVAIISIVLTIIGFLVVVGGYTYTYADGYNGGEETAVVIGISFLIFSVMLIPEVMCLLGAIKNNKCLLIPFMIAIGICILASLGLAITCVVAGASKEPGTAKIFIPLAVFYILLFGFSIYSLYVNTKFYKELSSGPTVITQDESMLVPYDSLQDSADL